MSFSRWLRSNAEHYLLIAAQDRVARQHGARGPRPPHGLREFVWLRIFAPVYRALPWRLRHKIMLTMPGSHRRQWAPPPQTQAPALPTNLSSTSIQQVKESSNGPNRG
jgi:hypothetical protein